MANIGKYGGIATVTASTTPTGHTITGIVTEGNSWFKIYQTGTTLIASADTNTNANDRNATLTVRVTTTSSSAYEPTSTAETRTFTVSQAGTGTTEYIVNVRFTNEQAGSTGVDTHISDEDWNEVYLENGETDTFTLKTESVVFTVTLHVNYCTIDPTLSPNPTFYLNYGTFNESIGTVYDSYTEYTFTSSSLTYDSSKELIITIA